MQKVVPHLHDTDGDLQISIDPSTIMMTFVVRILFQNFHVSMLSLFPTLKAQDLHFMFNPSLLITITDPFYFYHGLSYTMNFHASYPIYQTRMTEDKASHMYQLVNCDNPNI
jgi:hypothetical protein